MAVAKITLTTSIDNAPPGASTIENNSGGAAIIDANANVIADGVGGSLMDFTKVTVNGAPISHSDVGLRGSHRRGDRL